MSYFPVDDDFTFHPKALSAGNEACGVWVRAGAWSKKHVTGGFIPAGIAESLGDSQHLLASRLVSAGLCEVVDGGYRFHDWEQQAGNADAATEKARREQSRRSARERQARARAAKAERHGDSHAVTSGVNHAGTSLFPSPIPNDVTLTDTSQSRSRRARDVTDEPSTQVIRAMAGQLGLRDVGAIVAAIEKHTGCEVSGDRAVGIASEILSKAKSQVRAPQKYVLAAIAESPFEIQSQLIGDAA